MDGKEVEHLYKEAKARGEIIGLVAELEKENKELKERLRYYKTKSEFLNKVIVKYQEENNELKEKLEEADKYVVLQKIKNGEF